MLLPVGLREWEPCVPTLEVWTPWEEEQYMAGMGLPKAEGALVITVPFWFPAQAGDVCLSVEPGCHKVQGPHGLGAAEPALLWLPCWSSLPHLPPLLPAVAFPLLLPPYCNPPYTSWSPWLGQQIRLWV